MSLSTFESYLDNAANDWLHNKMRGQRKGQSYMNTLAAFSPMEYRAITGTAADPFYNDAVVPAFLRVLSDVFDEQDARHDEDDDEGCEGHESLRGDSMGVSVYCDGSCVR